MTPSANRPGPASLPDPPPGSSALDPATDVQVARGDAPARRSACSRLKVWFARPTPKRNSYVSDVTDPDDRRYIPRR